MKLDFLVNGIIVPNSAPPKAESGEEAAKTQIDIKEIIAEINESIQKGNLEEALSQIERHSGKLKSEWGKDKFEEIANNLKKAIKAKQIALELQNLINQGNFEKAQSILGREENRKLLGEIYEENKIKAIEEYLKSKLESLKSEELTFENIKTAIIPWRDFNPRNGETRYYLTEPWDNFFAGGISLEGELENLTVHAKNETELLCQLKAEAAKQGLDLSKMSPRAAVIFACRYFSERVTYDQDLANGVKLNPRVDTLSVEELMERGKCVCRHYGAGIEAIFNILKTINPNLNNTYLTFMTSHNHLWLMIYQFEKAQNNQPQVLATMIDPTSADGVVDTTADRTGFEKALGVEFDANHPRELVLAHLAERAGYPELAKIYYAQAAARNTEIKEYLEKTAQKSAPNLNLDNIWDQLEKMPADIIKLQILYKLLGIYYQNGTQSISDYQKACNLIRAEYPNREFKTKLFLADYYYKCGKYEEAENLYKSLIEKNPLSSIAEQSKLNLVLLAVLRSEYQKAENLLAELKNDFPNDLSEFDFYQAYIWMNKGEYEKAMVALREIARKYPDSKFAMLALEELAVAEINAGKIKDGIADFKKLISSFPQSDHLPELKFTLFDLYWKLDNRELALEQLQNVLSDPKTEKNPETNLAASIYALYLKKNYPECLRLMNSFVGYFPDSSHLNGIYELFGLICRENGSDQLFKETLTGLIENREATPPGRYFAYQALINYYFTVNNFDQVLEITKNYRSQTAPLSASFSDLVEAQAYLLKGNLSKSRELANRLIASSADEDTLESARMVLIETEINQGDFKRAENAISTLLVNSPEKQMFYRGKIEVLKEDYAAAAKLYEKIENEYPDSRFKNWSLKTRGYLLAAQGDLEASNKIFENLLKSSLNINLITDCLIMLGANNIDEGNLALAKEYLTKAESSCQSPEYKKFAQALSLFADSRLDEALNLLTDYISKNSVYKKEAKLFLAQIYLKNGNTEKAKNLLEELAADYSSEYTLLQARKALEKIK